MDLFGLKKKPKKERERDSLLRRGAILARDGRGAEEGGGGEGGGRGSPLWRRFSPVNRPRSREIVALSAAAKEPARRSRASRAFPRRSKGHGRVRQPKSNASVGIHSSYEPRKAVHPFLPGQILAVSAVKERVEMGPECRCALELRFVAVRRRFVEIRENGVSDGAHRVAEVACSVRRSEPVEFMRKSTQVDWPLSSTLGNTATGYLKYRKSVTPRFYETWRSDRPPTPSMRGLAPPRR